MTDLQKNIVEAAAELGRQANGAEIITIDNVAQIEGVPDKVPAVLMLGIHPQILPINNLLDHYRILPARKKGTACAQSLDGFIDLTKRHQTQHSAVFASTNWEKPSLTTIINYHRIDDDNGKADFLDHKVHYSFPLSDEWVAWQEKNKEKMSQEDFALFVEEQIACLATPTEEEEKETQDIFMMTLAKPTKMMELSRGLKVTVNSEVGQDVRLSDGTGSLTWNESHKDMNGKPLNVPGAFMLCIAPFKNGERIRLKVLLRYRVMRGVVSWYYQIYRPDIAIVTAVKTAMDKVAQETGLPVFEAEAERP